MKDLIKKTLCICIAASALFISVTSCRQSNDSLVIPTDATWPPFEFVDTQTGEIIGFDIDLFNEIADRIGIEVSYTNVAWDALLAGISQGMYKCSVSAITIKESRFGKMDFSIPYYTSGQVLVVNEDNCDIQTVSDCIGNTVGAETGTTASDIINSTDGVTCAAYDDLGLGFIALKNKQIVAVLCDKPMAEAYMNKYGGMKIVGNMLTVEDYGIAFTKGYDPEFQNKVNTCLQEMFNDGSYDKLLEKWDLTQ